MALVTLFCPEIPEPGESTVLDAGESHHAVRVRRFSAGDTVRLVDGCGVIARGQIKPGVRGQEIVVEICERHTQRPPPRVIHVAAALPKGDRQATLFDMLTQLGVSSFTPLHCERSVVRPGKAAAMRWRRVCVEACKQSGNAYLPVLHGESTPDQAVESMRMRGAACFLAHAGASSEAARYPGADPVGLFIGPEGGFTEPEVRAALDKGAVPIALGRYTLRIETAAVAWVSAVRLNQHWKGVD
ncbi:MAG: 16S rRNA (uracil(1498)-N(3))-methyltransferase [Gammaproteobacteria bacterium]|nr:16S rRNA (uracil(1498)-N(3))-methyltransferase [Gammaproteobacteria bacterium]